eukprot:CAMPEP_0169255154 /NCGR_PEP_ID=MMETSP1016-20121227/39571_1 /TAXON_ID=342587 /ORGANISM="Karlodinium micrum, Strain CCMP2283" /LENGTH=133 /DNA_ID=CAMNT_0009336691 /DNA_START=433 /DNA_END=831 /DNA_ORIENTATION=-
MMLMSASDSLQSPARLCETAETLEVTTSSNRLHIPWQSFRGYARPVQAVGPGKCISLRSKADHQDAQKRLAGDWIFVRTSTMYPSGQADPMVSKLVSRYSMPWLLATEIDVNPIELGRLQNSVAGLSWQIHLE